MARKFYGKAGNELAKNLSEKEQEKDDASYLNEEADEKTNRSTMNGLEQEKTKRKRKLKEELMEQHKEKLSRQKKKRLDKYIEHQLKREEKEILFKKLEETRIDTSILKSAKLIGSGDKKTKKEKIAEAMELERLGKSTDQSRSLLYEEREIKSWDQLLEEDKAEEPLQKEGPAAGETFASTLKSSSGFIDYRPAKPFSGMGTGFGFGNIEKVKSKKKKKGYSWRNKLEEEQNRSKSLEDDKDFVSSSSDEEEEEEEDDDDDDDDDEADNESKNDANIEADEDDEDSGSNYDNVEDDDNDENLDDDSDEDDDIEIEVAIKKEHTKKAKDFKEWAEEQVRKIEGRESFEAPTGPQMTYDPIVRKEDLDDGLKEDFIPINEKLQRKIVTVNVQRSAEIQDTRSKLPVYAEESRIMEAIHHNDCVIICGETGSGKTTQVPQFLFESGYGVPGSDTPGIIGVTQPRRVAAVSMANRVSRELGNYSDRVGYQIRFDATVGDKTSLKFMTDGVLLREMMNDFLLMKYSALVIDEAHERNVNTDILIGMLSRVLKLRREYHEKQPEKFYPLKLIIMSATLRVGDFSENKVLFDIPPPILKVDARQYPVSTHFNKRTPFDYTDETFRKVCKIHRKLPKGAILVFMTGKAEIIAMVNKLRKEFPFKTKKVHRSSTNKIEDEPVDIKVDPNNADIEAEEIDFNVNEIEINEDYAEAEEEDEDEDEEGFEETLEEDQTENDPLYVLPLYSLLPTKEQMKIFEDPPSGSRLCVVATNVAETSLTIPNVRYVVDCGRAKERKYDEETGVQSFEIDWISKASADQRSGRAGRTGPGHCYRIYSSAVYESEFPQFSRPEILRMPVEGVVLNMKSMGIQMVINFPFPTPPNRHMLQKAEQLLKYLGALDKEKLQITSLGKKMSLFPLSPRFSKILLIANQQGCLPYVIALVSGMSVGDPFLTEYDLGIQVNKAAESTKDPGNKKEDQRFKDEYKEDADSPSQFDLEKKRRLRQKFNKSTEMFSRLDKYSDSLKILSAICASDHIPRNKRGKFYEEHFLREKQMSEIEKLRKQLTYIVKIHTMKERIAISAHIADEEMKLAKPAKKQVQAIKQMIAAGFIDQIAFRLDVVDKDFKLTNNMKIMNVPYLTPAYIDETRRGEGDDVFHIYIHPSSIILKSGKAPQYLVYSHLQKSASTKTNKVRMLPLNDIGSAALVNVGKATGLITYSKPLGKPVSALNSEGVETRECHVVPRYGAQLSHNGGGVDLAPQRVAQQKVCGAWEII
ncbi:hypothetical protein PMKS-000359 [Pichia membranifaciens]|uniref:RNA helicase n=1 Tax=Pichia membranifaciens TaxID=4926 RepID=A0A1Q2YBM8_9ASCO|nr:hypothetical protein PMKS-000359 [Pichia membranifaciens]